MTECNSPKSPDGKHKEIAGVSNRGHKNITQREIIKDGKPCTEIRTDIYAYTDIICFYCGKVLAEGYSNNDLIYIDSIYKYV